MNHEWLRCLKMCPRTLTPRQPGWSQLLEEYNLSLWYVPGFENPAAEACYRLTSRQLVDIKNATRTQSFVVPLVENWIPPEGEPAQDRSPKQTTHKQQQRHRPPKNKYVICRATLNNDVASTTR